MPVLWRGNRRDGEVIEVVEEEVEETAPSTLGEYLAATPYYQNGSQQYHYYTGSFSTGEKEFPVMLAIIMCDDDIEGAIYKNVGYGTQLTMSADTMGSTLMLRGEDGGNEFIMSLTPVESGLSGTATSGSTTLVVNLVPTSDTF